MYDPQALGARCDICPLRRDRIGGPVPGQVNHGADIVIVGEAPGKQEVMKDRPFVGASGIELMEALATVGLRRRDCTYLNALPCQPPKNKARHGKSDLNAYLLQCRSRKLPSPVECCRDRLYTEVLATRATQIIAAGEHAAVLLSGLNTNIGRLRGRPQEVELEGVALKVMPIWHPAFILRNRAMRPRMREDLARAIRFFEDRLLWKDFNRLYDPTIRDIIDFVSQDAVYWPWDTETTIAERSPRDKRIKLLQLGHPETRTAMVVPFELEGGLKVYGTNGMRRVREIIAEVLTDGRLLLGWNSAYFDRMVAEGNFEVTPANALDLIQVHKLCYPNEPHDLEYVTSVFTDAPPWKADHAGQKGWASDDRKKRVEYAATDVIVLQDIAPALVERADELGFLDKTRFIPEMSLLELDHWMSDCAVRFHDVGMFVLEEARAKIQAEVEKDLYGDPDDPKSIGLLGKIRRVTRKWGFREFNPNSHVQVLDLLYDKWDLRPLGWTDGGAPSVAEEHLIRHIIDDAERLGTERVQCLHDIRHYRVRRNKNLGTYIWKFARSHKDTWVGRDGRVHPDVRAHVVLSGRYAFGSPALQQMPFAYRTFFGAEPGRLMFGADMAQFHPRIFANLWKIPALQQAAAEGDIYLPAARAIFDGRDNSAAFDKLPGHPEAPGAPWKGQAKKARKFAKEFLLSFAYGAKSSTMWVNLLYSEDDDGNLALAHLQKSDVDRYRDKTLEAMPEFESGWQGEVDMAMRNAESNNGIPWLADPLVGRRREFPNGPDLDYNDMTNFRTLACESAIMHKATIRALEEIPWLKWGPGTGFVMQVHDQLSGEAPADQAEWAAQVVAEAMNIRVPGWDTTFHGDPTTGPTWADA